MCHLNCSSRFPLHSSGWRTGDCNQQCGVAACSRRDLGGVTGAPPARAYNPPQHQPPPRQSSSLQTQHSSLATTSTLDHGLVRGAGQCHVATSMFITTRDVCCVSICPCLEAGLVSAPDLGTRCGGGWLQRGRSQPSAGFLPGPVFTRASNEGPHEGS